MRNAFIISLAAHLILGFTALRLVRISQVRFVPREVYAVRLVSLQEGGGERPEEMKAPAKETPQPPAPQPEEKKPDELVAPQKQPKPQKKEAAGKTVPSTRVDERTGPTSQGGPGQGAGQRTGAGTGNVTTGDVSLDAADFPFAYYIATVRRKIASNWQVPGGSSEAVHCRVYFRITRSGAIDGASVETSSGSFLFDQGALRAVIQADPLPPLPGGFPDAYLGVHFSFAYEEE
ncbi:MAG: tonB [Candidatus Krumholzibacteriota bacterium]|jgi:TonB family protein|nr:tonB [Candidatus Krumholzibacteriota bacterium]